MKIRFYISDLKTLLIVSMQVTVHVFNFCYSPARKGLLISHCKIYFFRRSSLKSERGIAYMVQPVAPVLEWGSVVACQPPSIEVGCFRGRFLELVLSEVSLLAFIAIMRISIKVACYSGCIDV